VQDFGRGVRESLKVDGKRVPHSEFVQDNVKISLWLTAAEILACLHLEVDKESIRLEKRNLTLRNEVLWELSKAIDPPAGLVRILDGAA
jgi:hypothetical protein